MLWGKKLDKGDKEMENVCLSMVQIFTFTMRLILRWMVKRRRGIKRKIISYIV